jgi:sialate O-acetylesterase
MVLQRGLPVPVWGWAARGAKVTVRFGLQKVTAKANENGRWEAKLKPLQAGGPFEMVIEVEGGREKVKIEDVLVGEVYLCSGQSNMNWTVHQSGDPETEVWAGRWPEIRHYKVPERISVREEEAMGGDWKVCSPAKVGDFTAVGYYFARELHKTLKVPVGLIHASWGGTPVEAWTSRETLKKFPHARKGVLDFEKLVPDMEARVQEWTRKHLAWEKTIFHADPGNTGFELGFAEEEVPDYDWTPIDLPKQWQGIGQVFNGVFWFRKEVKVPRAWAGKDLEIGLGRVDQFDVTYFNNVQVGAYGEKDHPVEVPNASPPVRIYRIPGRLVKAGRNVIAVRVFNRFGNGGFDGQRAQMFLRLENNLRVKPISLAGTWRYRIEVALPWPPPEKQSGWPPQPFHASQPGTLFNGMIAPLIPYAIGGALWYQGESNAHDPEGYRLLFPAMIREWRQRWGREFPFFFVQLANFLCGEEPGPNPWANLRDAQNAALALPKTGMAVTIDIGDVLDIHPKNKQEVGRRLALQALKVAYGKKLVAAGPIFRSAKVVKSRVELKFDHADGGLKLWWGKRPVGFTIAGRDEKFVLAQAKIQGKGVTVWHPDIDDPQAVRYAWANSPVANIRNGHDLPMAQFYWKRK